MLLRLPNAIHHILYAEAEIGLTIASISERHKRWFCLCNGCQGQMWWPTLYEYHVASQQTCCICPASGVRFAPEDEASFRMIWVTQYVVQKNSKAVEVADV